MKQASVFPALPLLSWERRYFGAQGRDKDIMEDTIPNLEVPRDVAGLGDSRSDGIGEQIIVKRGDWD